ncbi:hypothetical protein GCM10023069_18700 [Shinella granuli]
MPPIAAGQCRGISRHDADRHLATEHGELKARISSAHKVREEELVGLDFDARTLSLFDAESGKALLSEAMKECSDMAEVVLENVTKRFGSTLALDNVSLTVPDGSFVVLLGPTGAGKTTTLRMVSGSTRPTAARSPSAAGR